MSSPKVIDIVEEKNTKTNHQILDATHLWATENKPAIDAYNEFIELHGCFGDTYRAF